MSRKPGATQAMHKVIMVGSGGVGKSALTLQFMYDEVKSRTKLLLLFFFIQMAKQKAHIFTFSSSYLCILLTLPYFKTFKRYRERLWISYNFNRDPKISLLKITSPRRRIPTGKRSC